LYGRLNAAEVVYSIASAINRVDAAMAMVKGPYETGYDGHLSDMADIRASLERLYSSMSAGPDAFHSPGEPPGGTTAR
jgi:hypothetical protein